MGGAGSSTTVGAGGSGAGCIPPCAAGNTCDLSKSPPVCVPTGGGGAGGTSTGPLGCDPGDPAPFAPSDWGTRAIALDATSVYYMNNAHVTRIAKDGTGVTDLGAPATNDLFAVDGSFLYWVEIDIPDVYIKRKPLAGGATTNLFAGTGLGFNVAALAAAPEGVFWLHNNPGTLVKTPFVPGISVDLALTPVEWIASVGLDPTRVLWSRGTQGKADGTVMAVPKSGGMPVTLASGQAGPWQVVVDATDVYWTNWGTNDVALNYLEDGAIMTIPLGGGTPKALVTGLHKPAALAVDGAFVYWSIPGEPGGPPTGAIMKAPKDGSGAPTALVQGVSPIMYPGRSLAVDATHVYWSRDCGGLLQGAGVMRTPK